MMKSAIALGLLIGLASPAFADYGGKWLCVEEFGGGIAYDSSTARWIGTNFRAEGKFVTSVTFRETGNNGTFDVDIYDVSISDFSMKTPSKCADSTGGASTFPGSGSFVCDAVLTTYHINLESGRFFRVYPVGYISGDDTQSDTPSIMAGTCTRFE